MELQHVNVKLFVEGDLPVAGVRFIEVFHQWIQNNVLDELLIDVADYCHVPAGPGVLLVGHEADYSMDHSRRRWGLRYNRKARLEGSNVDRFRSAFRSAAKACHLLEATFLAEGPLKFNRRQFELFVNDRAVAPNTAETFAASKPDLDAFLRTTFGKEGYSTKHQDDPRSRFGVTIELSKPFDLSGVLV